MRESTETEILLWQKEHVEDKVLEFNKKAKKLDVEPAILTWGDTRKVTWSDDWGFERVRVYIAVTLEWTAPVIDGWTLVGRFELVGVPIDPDTISLGFKDQLYVYPAPGQEIPKEYFDRDRLECQHCGHKRFRKNTFLFKTKENDYIEVGSTCMKDFLGHDPRGFMFAAGFDPAEIFSFDPDGEFGGYHSTEDPVYTTKCILALTSAAIEKFGWVPRWKVDENPYEHSFSTSDVVGPNLHPDDKFKKSEWYIKEVTDDNNKEAEAAIEYFKTIEPDSDYELNANTLARSGWVTVPKHLGLACSLVGSYRRIKAREEENRFDASKSTWFGEIKERIELDLEVYFATAFPGYMGGSTDLYLLKTDDGNVVKFTYSGSKMPQLHAGDKVRIRGTIKDHSKYKDVKQTVLTRCAMIEV